MPKRKKTIMKEQLISFETAKLAKEKGFPQIQDMSLDQKIDMHFFGYTGRSNNPKWELVLEEYHTDSLSAPTQSLLQKWLRELYNLHVAIYPIKEHWEMDVRTCDPKDNVHVSFRIKMHEYKTYEEALEKGLQEALKLINEQA